MVRKFFVVVLVALAGAFALPVAHAAAGDGSWAAPATLNQPEYSGAVATLADGRVLLAGGTFNDNRSFAYLDTAELYDPATRTWTAVPKMSSQRGDPIAARLADGRVFVLGGHYSDGNNQPIRYTGEIFDPATRTWSAPQLIPEDLAFERETATLPNGKTYFMGYSAKAYDPANGSWTDVPHSAFGAVPAVSLGDGRILGIGWGGVSGIFDTATDTWTRVGNYPGFIQEHQNVLLPDGRVFMTTYTGGSSDDQAAAVFDPATNAWTPTPATSQPFPGASVGLLPDGSVLAAGGYRTSTVTVSAQASVFSPGTNTWRTVASLPTPRVEAGSVSTAHGMMLIGGSDQNSVAFGDSIEYTLPSFANGEFAVSDGFATEGGPLDANTITFTLRLAAAAIKPVHLRGVTSDGTATAFDYGGGSFDVTVKKGESTATISVPVRGDLLNERDETFFLDVSDPKTGKSARAVGVIFNDDPKPCEVVDQLTGQPSCALASATGV